MIISIKSSASGGSSRGLVHYLAHSKLDREKEGIERREFFNDSEDDLDVSRANRNLSWGDTKAKPEELLHIVISPSREEIAKLGNDRDTRKKALKVIVQATVARLEKEVKARFLKWVAVVHFNTDNPHAHLAVQKQFLNENGKAEILRINRQMLHYNERGADGEKKLYKGTLILAAENKINEIGQTRGQEKGTERISKSDKTVEKSETRTGNAEEFSSDELKKIPNYRERRILAEEMLVALEIRRRTRNIENLVEHGDKKRFKIKDERTGNTRHVSLFDIERKIESISRRKARLAYPQNIERRTDFSVQIAQEERAKYEPVIRQLETIRRHVLGFENRHLSEAQEKHTGLHNQKLLIEKKYERLKMDAPSPIFNSNEIQQLQSEAIREQNSEKILLLESIRQSSAAELKIPSRRDKDVRELSASKIVAKLKFEAAEKRLLDFAANKDFIKVKIGDSLLSRRGLEQHELRAARKNDLWMQVKAKTTQILLRADKKLAPAEKLDYPALHKAVTGTLENLVNTRRDEIAKQKEFNQTLDKIFDAETHPNKTRLAPAFSAYELAEVEDLSHDAGRENFYENSLPLQESWLREKLAEKIVNAKRSNESPATIGNKTQNLCSEDKITVQFPSESQAQSDAEKVIGGYVLARVEARTVLAQIKVNQAAENLARNERDKSFAKHRILDTKTGAEREMSLRDVESRKHYYLLDSILEKSFVTKEQKHLRDAVRRAAQNKENELEQNLMATQNFAERLENQKTAMLEKFSTANEIHPIFTPKEIAALDARADRTTDKSEAVRLEKLVGEAEKNGRVERLQHFLDSAAKELEVLAPALSKKQEPVISRQNHSTDERSAVGQSQEISNQIAVSETSVRTSDESTKTAAVTNEKATVKEKGRTR
jgi:hypothetical protein